MWSFPKSFAFHNISSLRPLSRYWDLELHHVPCPWYKSTSSSPLHRQVVTSSPEPFTCCFPLMPALIHNLTEPTHTSLSLPSLIHNLTQPVHVLPLPLPPSSQGGSVASRGFGLSRSSATTALAHPPRRSRASTFNRRRVTIHPDFYLLWLSLKALTRATVSLRWHRKWPVPDLYPKYVVFIWGKIRLSTERSQVAPHVLLSAPAIHQQYALIWHSPRQQVFVIAGTWTKPFLLQKTRTVALKPSWVSHRWGRWEREMEIGNGTSRDRQGIRF